MKLRFSYRRHLNVVIEPDESAPVLSLGIVAFLLSDGYLYSYPGVGVSPKQTLRVIKLLFHGLQTS
jgi:hypothetical protein